MNKRIFEIVQEINGRVGLNWTTEDKEEFAELIVKECVDVGSQWADGLLDTKHYEFVNKKIKEHFGVE